MNGIIDMFVSFYRNVFNLFDTVIFDISGYSVSLGAIIFVCIALTMIVSIYWRGAKG